MGDVHERRPYFHLDALEFDLHLTTQLQVQRTERLVEQEDLRLVDERSSHRYPLLLPSGQLLGLAASHRRQLDEFEHRLHGRLHVLDSPPPKTEGDVLEDVQVRKQRIGLEDGVDRSLEGPQAGDVLLADRNRTLGGILEARHHPQGRGLSAAGGAKEGEETSGGNCQGEIVDCDKVTEPLRQVAKVKILNLA